MVDMEGRPLARTGNRRMAIRLLTAHRDQSSSTSRGWFPGSGTVPADFVTPSQAMWPSGLPSQFKFQYRCGGSAGILPASQFSNRFDPIGTSSVLIRP